MPSLIYLLLLGSQKVIKIPFLEYECRNILVKYSTYPSPPSRHYYFYCTNIWVINVWSYQYISILAPYVHIVSLQYILDEDPNHLLSAQVQYMYYREIDIGNYYVRV